MSVDETGTASVEAVKAPPVWACKKKPTRQVGKRFWDHHVAAPEKKKVKRSAGLRTRPAWFRQDRLGESPAVCRGRASLKAADGSHLVPQPDSNDEGAGAAAQDRVGAVVEQLKGWNQSDLTDPDEGGREQLG